MAVERAKDILPPNGASRAYRGQEGASASDGRAPTVSSVWGEPGRLAIPTVSPDHRRLRSCLRLGRQGAGVPHLVGHGEPISKNALAKEGRILGQGAGCVRQNTAVG